MLDAFLLLGLDPLTAALLCKALIAALLCLNALLGRVGWLLLLCGFIVVLCVLLSMSRGILPLLVIALSFASQV